MNGKINIIVSATPGLDPVIRSLGTDVARYSYKIERGFRLYGARNTSSGGLMGINFTNFSGGGPASHLVSEIVRECRRKNFSGVIFDASGPTLPLRSLCAQLEESLIDDGLDFFVPEPFADDCVSAKIMISSAISGGDFAQRLEDAAAAYGASKLALEIERVRSDFTLPSLTGSGAVLSQSGLEDLISSLNPSIYFSDELGVKYFYYIENEKTHFVLFDDLESVNFKLDIAEKMGVENAFIFYPDFADIIDGILDREFQSAPR